MLVASAVSVALCTLMFGFSVNFAMTIAARFLTGLVDGGLHTVMSLVQCI